ncbi:MAG: cold-shock protein [Nocardioides sp.]
MSGVRGVVRVWHDEEGWGVVDSEATPGGCWAHFSAVLVAGFRRLRVGQEVLLEAEAVEQDGYAFRAVEVWPADAAPVRTQPDGGPSAAYRSRLTISFDEDR